MVEASPQIIIIAGPNGAGKSTLAPLLLRDKLKLTEYVNADTIALGLSAFAPENAAIEAGRVMLKRLHDLAAQQKSFAFETTLATRSYAKWLKELIEQGYDVHLIYLWLRSPEIAIARVQERVRAGGHDVPETTIQRRYKRGAENFFGLYQKIVSTWTVFDHSTLNQAVMIGTGQGKANTIIFDDELWLRFCGVAK
ncbi:MAG TPA: zeta toxin family protein [Blastocatellia bacterium]|nr:zeta toxin family protein [Blastocatellia bacterium]